MAMSEIYVDPSIAADSGTGTIGDPFGDLEYAIKQTTFDTTNGTRVNIKAGTAEVLAAPLNTAMADTSVSVAWAPTNGAHAVFQGYTTTAGDGGIAEIDLTSANSLTTNIEGVVLCDLSITGSSSGDTIVLGNYCAVLRCRIIAGAGVERPIYINSSRSLVSGNYVSGGTVRTIQTSGSPITYNYATGPGIVASSSGGGVISRNILVATSSAVGCSGASGVFGTEISNNSIYNVEAGTGSGVLISGIGAVFGNIIEGWSGTGGVGIKTVQDSAAVIDGNSIFNCATAIDVSGGTNVVGDGNETLSESAFTSPGTGDFSPVDTGSVKEGMVPDSVGWGMVV